MPMETPNIKPPADAVPSPPARRRLLGGARRKRRALLVISTLLILIVIIGELVARLWLGLGDPPLYNSDPQLEYIARPSSRYHRMGRVHAFNAYSMRSDEFPARKSDPDEVRVMVLGDSVVAGTS